MKVHVVTSANRALYGHQFEQMHRLRHKVFVDELKWKALASDNGLEIDDYDSEESAVYLLACEREEVFGSVRLLPTWRRCMLKELWSDYASVGEVQTGAGIWEWTRWCPGTITRRRELIRARNALIVASLEFARSRSIDTYLTFCEPKFIGQFEELNWRPEPLGLPKPFAEGMALGIRWQVSADLLAATRRRLRIHETISFEVPMANEAGQAWSPAMFEALLKVSDASNATAILGALGRLGAGDSPRASRNLETIAIQGTA